MEIVYAHIPLSGYGQQLELKLETKRELHVVISISGETRGVCTVELELDKQGAEDLVKGLQQMIGEMHGSRG